MFSARFNASDDIVDTIILRERNQPYSKTHRFCRTTLINNSRKKTAASSSHNVALMVSCVSGQRDAYIMAWKTVKFVFFQRRCRLHQSNQVPIFKIKPPSQFLSDNFSTPSIYIQLLSSRDNTGVLALVHLKPLVVYLYRTWLPR